MGDRNSVSKGIDLSNLDFVSDEEEYSEDTEEKKDIIEELEPFDYQGIFNLEFEDLKKLKEHNDNIQETTSDDMHNTLRALYKNIFDTLNTSTATEIPLPSVDNKDYLNIAPGSLPDIIENDVNISMISLIVQALTNTDNCTPNDVINGLLKSGTISYTDLEENQDVYINYLNMLIPEVRVFIERGKHDAVLNSLQRKNTANYLLSSEHKLLEEAQGHPLAFIKQIFVDANGVYCDCPSCFSKVQLNNIVLDYIVFVANIRKDFDLYDSYSSRKRGSNCSVFPRIHYCKKCTTGVTLAPYDLVNIQQELNKLMKHSVSSFVQESATFGSGTAYTRAEIPFSMITKYVSYMCFYDIDALNQGDTVTQDLVVDNTVDEELDEIVIDFVEIKAAATQFYKKLLGETANQIDYSLNQEIALDNLDKLDSVDIFDENLSVEHNSTLKKTLNLSYHELAIYMSNNLSRNYNKLKHQALFSILFVLNENIHIESLLDMSAIIALENTGKFISGLPTDANTLSLSEQIEVNMEYNKLFDNATEEVDLQFKLDSLKNYLHVILEVDIQKRKSAREQFFQDLVSNIDVLANTKIINLNQCKVTSVYHILTDKSIIAFMDELTDRMIINNLAEEYYSIYIRTKVFNPVSLKMADKKSDESKVFDSLNNMFGKVIDKYEMNTGKQAAINQGNVRRHFGAVAELTNYKLKVIRAIYESFRNNDYYSFIMAIDNVTDIDSKNLSSSFMQGLSNLIEFSYVKVEELQGKSYTEYYLSDFTKEEIADCDMSTVNKMNRLTFGLYVPKRLDGESLSAYVERYMDLKNTGQLVMVDHYDYTEKFKEFRDFFSTIIMCSSVTSISYNSYTQASFIAALSQIAVEDIDRDFAIYLFSLNERMLARLEHDSETFDSSVFDCNSICESCKLLSGHYSNLLVSVMDNAQQQYTEMSIDSNVRFPTYSRVFNVIDILKDIYAEDDTALLVREQKYQSGIKESLNSDTSVDIADIDVQEIRDTIINEVEIYGEFDLEERLL